MPNFYKTKMCFAFLANQCNKGDKCTYAHGNIEIQTYFNPNYKTSLCINFQLGKCSNVNCKYAHG